MPACLRAQSHEYGNADALIFFPLNGQFLRIPVMMTGQSGSIDTRTRYPQSPAASGHEQPVDSGKADAQREGDRHVAARGRTVHDFQQRRAAPCRKVSASTDLLGRSHDQFVIVIVRV